MFRSLVLCMLPLSVMAEVKCVDPPRSQPDYCCKGVVPNMEFIDSCECNHDWSGEQCTCNGIVLKQACHSCMVHLPASNMWDLSTFSESELFDNCESCVKRCQSDLKEGMCSDYADD